MSTMIWSEFVLAGGIGWGCTFNHTQATSVCLSGKDAVNPFMAIAAAEAIERIRNATLACAKKRVRASELVVFGKYQQAFAGGVEPIQSARSKHLTVILPSHRFCSPHVFFFLYEQAFLSWDPFDHMPQFLSIFLIQLCVRVGPSVVA